MNSKTCKEKLFTNNDWEYLISEKKLNAIERVPFGRINFGICTIKHEFVIIVGGINSNNEYKLKAKG